MIERKSRFIFRFLSVGFVMFLLVFPALAELDPDPNSPTPVLISQPDSTRALAESTDTFRGRNTLQTRNDAFRLNQTINLYVTNVDLMEGEGADAFRVYVTDALGRSYRFPVLDLEPIKGQEWIYKLKVLLKDDLGFWDQPKTKGDVLINVTWRGLQSNDVKLGLGRTGGTIGEGINLVPTPLADFSQKPKATPTSEYVGYRFSGDRKRFLEQATFGPTQELDQRLRRIGLRTWLAEQFEMSYPSPNYPYPDIPLKQSDSGGLCNPLPTSEERRLCYRDFYTMYPVQKWFFQEALYGDAQLRHRVAWALSQIWVTSGEDVQQGSHMIAYHKILSQHAFGNYRDLMRDVTLNPAMGDYLDMVRSSRNSPNENFAREILQLFTVGLFQLNQNGTLKLDSSGDPIPTYNQETVNNFTKVFTGWQTCDVSTNSACVNITTGAVNYKDPMIIRSQGRHDITAKNLLDYTNAVNKNIPAGQTAEVDLEQALDNIFYHPNVAPFVSRLLIQHLVTSDPTAAYVSRVSTVFRNNGSGVRGDLKAVVRAILLDPEARGDFKTAKKYGKLREPVQYMTNILRQFGAASADGTQNSDGAIWYIPANLGQNPFYSPTVFNYYTPDYSVPGTSLNAPEFGVMTTSTAIARANFSTIISFAQYGAFTDSPRGLSINRDSLIQAAADDSTGNKLLDELDRRMMYDRMSSSMRTKILTAVRAISANAPEYRAQTALFLVASSSQYQIQR